MVIHIDMLKKKYVLTNTINKEPLLACLYALMYLIMFMLNVEKCVHILKHLL